MRGDDAGRRKILDRPTTRGGKDVWRLCIDGELVTWRDHTRGDAITGNRDVAIKEAPHAI